MNNEERNIKPSELFNSDNSIDEKKSQNSLSQNIPIDINLIPQREDENEESPALYKGTEEQNREFNLNTNTNDIQIDESKYENLDLSTLKKFVLDRDKEIFELSKTFKEFKSYLETLKIEKENFETQVETLKTKIEMKDTQISTLQETIKMKDEQLSMKNDQVKMKEDQMRSYKSSLDDKNKVIEELKSSSVERSLYDEVANSLNEKEEQLKEKEELIKSLEEEAKALSEDISLADDEIAKLHNEIEELKNQGGNAVYLSEKQVEERLREILGKSLHNVNLTVPKISNLLDLDIFDLKSSVNLKISCEVDSSKNEDSELYEEFGVFDNIQIRQYGEKDRFSILVDGAILFFAALGNEGDRYLTFHTEDPEQIKIFNSLVLDSWLRAQKI